MRSKWTLQHSAGDDVFVEEKSPIGEDGRPIQSMPWNWKLCHRQIEIRFSSCTHRDELKHITH